MEYELGKYEMSMKLLGKKKITCSTSSFSISWLSFNFIFHQMTRIQLHTMTSSCIFN